MRALVLGAGGIGGYFGGRLVEAGLDVTFLVREKRAALLRDNGLVIESPLGDARLEVRTTTAPSPEYDLVLLGCKAYDLDAAIAAIRPAVGAGTAILPLLNGLVHLETLDQVFGSAAVLGGLALISATLTPAGHVRHLGTAHGITFGARSADQESRCAAIEQWFAAAPFQSRNSPVIEQEMWEKFAFITAAAAITCLMRAPVGAIVRAPDGEKLTRTMLAECEAVAAAAGFPVRPQAQERARRMLIDPTSNFTASMLRDIEGGANIEADHLQGDMIRRADALGIDVNLLRVAFCHLRATMNRREAPAA